MRCLRVEDERSIRLGQDQRSAGVNEEGRIPRRQEADRRRRVRVRQGRIRQVQKLTASLVAHTAQLEAFDDRTQRAHRHARPVGDIGQRRRTETTEVAADEMLPAPLLADDRPTDPVLGEAV